MILGAIGATYADQLLISSVLNSNSNSSSTTSNLLASYTSDSNDSFRIPYSSQSSIVSDLYNETNSSSLLPNGVLAGFPSADLVSYSLKAGSLVDTYA